MRHFPGSLRGATVAHTRAAPIEVELPRFRPQQIALLPNEVRPTCLTYETFFGLAEKPFSVSSDPRFLYKSRSHATALEDMLAGIRRRDGLIVLTGDIGTGKTTLCRAALQNLDSRTLSAFVPDPFASREDLLKMLLIDFGVMSIHDLTSGRLKDASRTELSYLLYEFMDTLVPLDAFVVVIIDEAQNMSPPLVEEIRILSDSNGRDSQLQVVFVGQLELNSKWRLPEMRQVSQRVSVQCTLQPLDRDSVAEYVAHRLRVAGGSPDRVSFTADAVDAVFLATGGVPRLINRTCDRALHQAYVRRTHVVDGATVEAVAHDDLTSEPPRSLNTGAPHAVRTQLAAPPPVVSLPVLPPQAATVTAPAAPVPPTPALPVLAVPAPPLPATALPPSPPPVAAVPVPRPPAAAPAAPLPSIVPMPVAGSRAALSEQVDVWLAQVDVEATGAPVRIPEASAPAEGVAAFDAEYRRVSIDRSGQHHDPRAVSYVHRVGRRWARKLRSVAMWAIIGVVVLSGGALAVPHLATGLAGITEPTALPALPPAPRPVQPSAAARAPRESAPAGQPAAAAFLIEVALFKTVDRAERLADELRQAGFSASQRPFTLRLGGVLQQVLIGPYATRADADQGLLRLRNRPGHQDARVVGNVAIVP